MDGIRVFNLGGDTVWPKVYDLASGVDENHHLPPVHT